LADPAVNRVCASTGAENDIQQASALARLGVKIHLERLPEEEFNLTVEAAMVGSARWSRS